MLAPIPECLHEDIYINKISSNSPMLQRRHSRPKKKLTRLSYRGLDAKELGELTALWFGIQGNEKVQNTKSKTPKKVVIPKIVVEEVKFSNDNSSSNEYPCSSDGLLFSYDHHPCLMGFLHPSDTIYSAVSRNDADALKHIVMSGSVNINQLNSSGVTALHEAAYEGKLKCVEVLAQCGADVNCVDREGWTPLHAAVCGGKRKCAAALVASGANLRARNDDGLTPFAIAMQQRDKEMIKVLSSFKYSNASLQRPRIRDSRVFFYI